MRAARHPAPARRPGFAFFSLTLLPPGFERWVEWPWVVDCGGRDLQELRESVRPPHAQQDVLEYGAHAINREPYDRVLVAVGDVAAGPLERKSVVGGKRVGVGGWRIIKKKKKRGSVCCED